MAHWQFGTVIATLSLLLTAGSIKAQSLTTTKPDRYGGLSLGTATYFNDRGLDYDYVGFVVAGQLGFRISPEIRVEGELAYETTSGEAGGTNATIDLDVLRLAGTAYYDFNAVSFGGLLPFVGVGLGFSSLDFEGGGDDTEVSANLDGGASLSLSRLWK